MSFNNRTIDIDDLVGVRYCFNGRSKETGFDCYGLAIEVSKRFGHIMPDVEEAWKEDRDFLHCEGLCLSKVEVKRINEPQTPGDVILIKNSRGILNHIGIYLGDGRFIHCNKLGVHLDRVSQYKMLIGRVYKWL